MMQLISKIRKGACTWMAFQAPDDLQSPSEDLLDDELVCTTPAQGRILLLHLALKRTPRQHQAAICGTHVLLIFNPLCLRRVGTLGAAELSQNLC